MRTLDSLPVIDPGDCFNLHNLKTCSTNEKTHLPTAVYLLHTANSYTCTGSKMGKPHWYTGQK
nr:hypothetical protein [Bacteroidota bacterium]